MTNCVKICQNLYIVWSPFKRAPLKHELSCMKRSMYQNVVSIWGRNLEKKSYTFFFFFPLHITQKCGYSWGTFQPPIHKSTKDDDAPFKDRIQTGLPHPLSFRCKQKEDLPKCDLSLNWFGNLAKKLDFKMDGIPSLIFIDLRAFSNFKWSILCIND